MHKLIITTSKGLDELLKTEVEQILSKFNQAEKFTGRSISANSEGINDDYELPTLQLQPGQVSFIGSLKDAYQL
jgi:23S rRNA (guanine2445-N2)-methyltransferase / 23S rRNA (guanine2069-N7)-methyltransferase